MDKTEIKMDKIKSEVNPEMHFLFGLGPQRCSRISRVVQLVEVQMFRFSLTRYVS